MPDNNNPASSTPTVASGATPGSAFSTTTSDSVSVASTESSGSVFQNSNSTAIVQEADSSLVLIDANKEAAQQAAIDAAVAQAAAEDAQEAAELALDSFDDKYLGFKSSDPSTDNDGNTLTDGALYYNTTFNSIKVYDLATTTWLLIKPTSAEQTNINTVSGDSTDIQTLANISSDISTVSGISSDVTAVANISTDIQDVQDQLTAVQTVADDLQEAVSEIETVAADIANVNTVAGISPNVTTVANNDTNITTVANNTSDINTVAGISSDVTTVAADGADIGTVAGISSDVTTVSGVSSDVTTVSGISANVTTVAGDTTNIGTVAGISSDVTSVAGISADVTTVAADGTDIGTVAGISSDVTTVSGISGNVTTVAGISSDVTTVATDSANITTVAGISSDVTSVAGISSDVTTVAADGTDIGTVAEISSDIQTLADIEDGTNATNAIQTVSGISSDVTTVSGISSNVTTVANDGTDIGTVAGISSDIQTLADIEDGTNATNAIQTVSGISSNVSTVAGISSNVTTVAGDSTDIGVVSGLSGDIQTLADIEDGTTATNAIQTTANSASNIDTVAGSISNVNTVAGIDSDISTVSTISSNVTTVSGISGNVTTVAGISSDVTSVAGIASNVTTVANNISDVNNFADTYRIGSSDPTTSLDEGDLFFNTTDNALKYYNGASWSSITAGLTDIVGDTTPQLGGTLDVNGNTIDMGTNVISDAKVGQWDTSYGWGDHSVAGYLEKSGGTMTGALTLSGAPTANLHATTKAYVDGLIAAGIHYHDPVRVEAPDNNGSLNTLYDNGTNGVGATLTNNGTQAALVIDGVTLATSDRVLIYNQTNAFENGIYTVTNTGSASTNWVLTRATDADSYGLGDNSLSEGTSIFVLEGDDGSGEVYACTTTGTITFGITAINFSQIGRSAVISGGTSITVDSNTVSVTDNSITATQLKVPGNGTTLKYLRSDGDGSFSWDIPVGTTYSVATSSTAGLVKVGYTENGKNYPVELNNDQMFVNVPWTDTDTNTTYSEATSGTLGLVKVGYTESGKNYPVELSSGQMFVNVPWVDTNTTYSTASSSTLGLVKTGYTANNKNYPVQLSSGQMFVNVPWVDTDTNTTYLAGTGLTLTGTTFSLTDTYVKKGSNNGATTIIANDADFIVQDTTDSTTNIIWRDHSANTLFLGTANAQPKTRYDLYTDGGNKYWHAGNDGSGSGLDADNLDGYTWASSGKDVRATEFYADNWFRNYNSLEGLYNQATGQHWYSDHDDYWNIAGGSGANGIRFRDEHNGTLRGSVYADNGNSIGFLDSDSNWAIKHVRDSRTEFLINNVEYAEINTDYLTHTSDIRSPIFYDSNNTNYLCDPSYRNYFNQSVYSSSTPLIFSTTSTALFNHDSNSGPVAFKMQKAGNSFSDGGNFGVLQLSRTNHNNSATGAGAGLYFVLKDSGGTSREYAGIFGKKTTSGASGGELVFMNYGRNEVAYCNSDYFYHNSDIRSPIFYDSADTGYYLNPPSVSKINDVWLEGQIFHNGDTNTYHEFHASDQWRVVTGGSERLEVNNNAVTISNAGFRAGTYGPTIASGTFTPDFNNYNMFLINMSGNITLANTTSGQNGQSGVFVFWHYTGPKTLSVGSYYATPDGAGITLSAVSGVRDVVPYVINASGNILLGKPILGVS